MMDLLGYALFFAAWVGHSAWWLVGLNMLYSRPLPRWILKSARLSVGVLVFIFPFILWWLEGFRLAGFPPEEWSVGSGTIGIYLALCWAMALLAIPTFTIVRHLRWQPPQLQARMSRVVDVARNLGYKPAGNGKYRRLACLPANQVFQVEFSELRLQLPGLPPAWDGLTILHLSDLHFSGTPDRVFYEQIIKQCMADGIPDIVAITGDFVDSDTHFRWLLPLLRGLEWTEGAFAILGNHDVWHRPARIRRRLQKCGIAVLGNDWKLLRVRGEPILVVGHEGPWFGPPPNLATCPAQTFRLCLSHTPDNIRWAQRNGIHLMLSGHNHGGQIRLPLFGSLFVPSWYSRRYDCGLFWEPPTLLHVSRGLAGKEPLRYLCRPQVTR
ncbi:MAG TPA: metallophosphoesterase, partial [Gemmataceae bacterium]|nr:metallophosphoesterase [Gemmataceae bacterium]